MYGLFIYQGVTYLDWTFMRTTWILIANAGGARLFSNRGPQKGLELLKTFDHPEGREKTAELVTDRPGHNKSVGNGHGAYVAATDPKYHAAESFAQRLTKKLEQGRIANNYDQLIVVAAPNFLGLLNKHFSSHVRSLLSERLQKDYTKVNEKELSGYLEKYIFL